MSYTLSKTVSYPLSVLLEVVRFSLTVRNPSRKPAGGRNRLVVAESARAHSYYSS